MKKRYIIFLIAVFVFLTNCKKPEDNIVEEKIFPPRIDITDAIAIFSIDANENNENFFKITNEHNVELVKYINTDGETIYPNPTFADRSIGKINIYGFGVSDDFILIKNYHNELWDETGTITSNYDFNVVEKNTGVITKLEHNDGSLSYDAQTPLQESSNNYYFLAGFGNRAIYQLNKSFGMEKYSTTDMTVYSFVVNNNDYILCKVADENYNKYYLLQSPSGDIFSVDDNVESDVKTYWKGTDGEFYILREEGEINQDKSVCIDRIEIDDGNISIINVSNNIISFSLFGNYQNQPDHLIQKLNNAVLFTPNKRISKSWLYDEVSQEFSDFSSYLPITTEVYSMHRSADYFYIATKSNILKFDFSYNYTEMLNEADYDIYSMCVNENNEIVFNAVRNNDGKVVIGFITSSGTVEILDDTINKVVEELDFL